MESAAPRTPTERARALRRSAGDAERKFWSRVRGHRLGGWKFRRQVPLGPFIADFVCAAARIVIELDGDQHAEAAAYDAARTRYLEQLGYCVLRFPTRDVLHEIERVLDAVYVAVEERSADRQAES